MPSLFPDYQYDIFISYRHNDNRTGWVTEFVNALQKELAATIKDPVSVYFDTNPYDGLLETHNVDKSLEGKLKCLIFIPILSQTYCDQKSFAWQHEFCAFNKFALNDRFGRDIKLGNGNVTSRILPIKIHDLDAEDKTIIENEIGGVLRSVEFIYQEPGVNRPLSSGDSKSDNQKKTDYRNQVNKVANAIKDSITSLRNPVYNREKSSASIPATKPLNKKGKVQVAVVALAVLLASLAYFVSQRKEETTSLPLGRSIAVLPFEDMSPGKDQEYLGDGLAEEIINVLTRIEDLHVIGRTSSFSFKGKNTDLITIGEQLGVETILEGSVRKSGNQIRVTAQLNRAKDGSHLWSETYDRELNDIFAIQDDISARIADRFKSTMKITDVLSPPTRNTDAYELYLKAHQASTRGLTGAETARDYMEKAIALDSTFVSAYAELSYYYWVIRLFGLGDADASYFRARSAALKAIELDPQSYSGYAALSWINSFIEWDWATAKANFDKALTLGLPQPDRNQAFVESILGRPDESIRIIKDLLTRDPLSVEYQLDLSRMNLYAGRFDDVLVNGEKILLIDPKNTSNKRHMGEAYLFSGNPLKALNLFEELNKKDPSYSPQGYVGALVNLGRKEEAFAALQSLPESTTPVKRAMCYIHLNLLDSAFKYLENGYAQRDTQLTFLQVDPNFSSVREEPRYKAMVRKMNFPKDY